MSAFDGMEAGVAVVGAGVMGLATARALARAGQDVVVLEQFRVGHERGSSHGTSRIFRLSYPEERWVRLALEALPLWRELEAEAGETLLELHGSIDLGDWSSNRDALDACGVQYVVLDRFAAERRFGLALTPGEEGLFQPDGGVALADKTLTALATSASANGARILEETRVVAVSETEGGVRIDLESGSLEAGAAVVTAGAWAPRLVDLAEASPTRETTAYFAGDEAIPSLIDSTLEDGAWGYALAAPGRGAKAGVHKTGARTDPDAPSEPDHAIALAAGEWLARRFPRLAAEPVRVETCLYTNIDDDRFVCERRGRIVVGSPCSGHGFKFAPAIGKRLAAL
ncbi:MAG: FAD-dependent oxidoreductase, partial [Actinobacteria bacterium]|nr:FAD-dependent oxidoreductase [Actinomycetota bacterium]